MKERPILFSAAMVRAILEGRKTQTRRVVKPQPDWVLDRVAHIGNKAAIATSLCPYGVPGDRLWVRETWGVSAGYDSYAPRALTPHVHNVWYKAGGGFDFENGEGGIIRPSIFMPRWASRITLEITDVRVQRVQEIRPADAIAEGIIPAANSFTIDCDTENPCDGFRALWNSINAKRGFGWDKNPWVWALTFGRLP